MSTLHFCWGPETVLVVTLVVSQEQWSVTWRIWCARHDLQEANSASCQALNGIEALGLFFFWKCRNPPIVVYVYCVHIKVCRKDIFLVCIYIYLHLKHPITTCVKPGKMSLGQGKTYDKSINLLDFILIFLGCIVYVHGYIYIHIVHIYLFTSLNLFVYGDLYNCNPTDSSEIKPHFCIFL